MNVLVIGPSAKYSKGGMATVINEMKEDELFCREDGLDFYDSYIDGSKAWRILYSVLAYFLFCITKKSKKYDIYHLHVASRGSTFRKAQYAKLIKKNHGKVIAHMHGAEYLKFYEDSSSKKKKLIKRFLGCADAVVVLSQEWKILFEQVFGLNNCIVVENGINIEKLTKGVSIPRDTQTNFLSLGRLGKRKGTYDILSAVEILRNEIPCIKVYLAGDGEIEHIQKLIDEKGIKDNVEVVGWVNQEKKMELLSKVSTVLLPSYDEGLPMSILEGMACGKAIISTPVGGIPSLIRNENGILVEPGNVISLAGAMRKICTDIEFVQRCSHNNKKLIREEYSMNNMHKKLDLIYKNLMGGKTVYQR